uniref:Putative neurotoxin LTDF S-11 n=1 Tax=Dolomedes fimbriatus TaxID=1432569 RepID=A0A0K1D8H7_9ARAC|nr:putative neurotoxin LTDF S-11 [Dolomedes fimbriatus]
MKSITCIVALLLLASFTRGMEESEEIPEGHNIRKRSCYLKGEECTKDIDCCTMQCLCTTNDCRCGKRPRPSELRKYFTKRTCGGT